MYENRSKENILKRLRKAPLPAWDFNPELLADPFNGFEQPDSLIDSFLSRLEAVKGFGAVIDGAFAFAGHLKALQVENQWPGVFCAIPELKNELKLTGVDLIDQEPQSGSNWVAVTSCEALVALTGSVMVSSRSGPGRRVHAGPETHIVYAGISQLRSSIIEAYREIADNGRPSWIGLITGPSRTADIEKTLVLGAHGPKNLMVFIDRTL